MIKRLVFFATAMILWSYASSQQRINDEKFQLVWKIEKDHMLTYRTITEVVSTDTSNAKMPYKVLLDKTVKGDSLEWQKNYKQLQEFSKKYYEGTENFTTISVLTKRMDQDIDVRFIVGDFSSKARESKSNANDKSALFWQSAQGVQLRGILRAEGGIESYYMVKDSKNLMAAFFELPSKAVAVGEEWPLEINWITVSNNFQCDSSERINKVKLLKVITEQNEQIAILKYTINEKVTGKFNLPLGKGPLPAFVFMGLEGICEFSITKGKWKSYSAFLTHKTTGYQNSGYTQRYELQEIDKLPKKAQQYLLE